MLQRLFRKKQLTIHLLHIGKTGGTSLIKMLEGISNTKYSIKVHPHQYTLKDIPESDKAIFFLRNPLDRFVSGFYSRKRKGQPTYNVPWNEAEEKAFKTFETPNELARALSSDNDELKNSAEAAMRGIRHVNTHFKDWLYSSKYLKTKSKKIYFIGFQENFDKDVRQLFQKLTRENLNSEVVKSHQTFKKENKELSEEAKTNLMQWYKDDFELYRFCETLALKVN